ncbi:MAG: ferrochelatase [Woeseiaceae bacterium]|nr:ferrochelatase [Woeseiaceae bacterium]
MPTYLSSPYEHGQPEALGVLVVNLGTPRAPTASAVRRYLGEFLWDPRVVELPRPLWWLVLHGVILRVRPARSARAYARIWTDDGSPLLLFSTEVADRLQTALEQHLDGRVSVVLGMSYGEPSINGALDELHDAGVRRLLVLPLYPQYSGTTTASVFDAVTGALRSRRWVPEFRFINHYHDAPGYIDALASSIREFWDRNGRDNKLMFSFHGVPRQMLLDGDPYHCQCQKTARLVADKLGIDGDDYVVSFQSRVGRAEWLQPYTDATIATLAQRGVKRLDVVCPGFAVDCLETLEEIAMQNAELFTSSGGDRLRYIPALNAREDHVRFLADLVLQQASGWPETRIGAGTSDAEREQSRQRALQMGAER